MNQLIPAEFHGTKISIIDSDGQKWLAAEDVGHCLGYGDANASAGVRNLYNRHADEFTESDARRINLIRRDGKTSEQLVFSDTGCIKLGFFANTKRAKEFRSWASRELAARQAEPPITPAVPLETNMASLAGDMAQLAKGMKTILTQMNVTGRYISLLEVNQVGRRRVTPTVRRQCFVLKGEGMANGDIARTLRISRTSVSLILNNKYPDTKVEDDPVSIGARLDAMIEREQALLLGQIDGGEE